MYKLLAKTKGSILLSSKISVCSFEFLHENRSLIPLLAHYYQWKRAYRNSVVYQYNPCKVQLQKRVPGCRNTINARVKSFIEHSLAYINDNGDLVLMPKRVVAGRTHQTYNKDHIWVKVDPDKDIKTQLYAALMFTKQRQVGFVIHDGYNIGRQSKELRAKTRLLIRATPMEISLDGLAGVFETTKPKARYITNKIVKMGLFKRKRAKLEYLGALSRLEMKNPHLSKGQFIFDNKLFYQGTTLYTPKLRPQGTGGVS